MSVEASTIIEEKTATAVERPVSSAAVKSAKVNRAQRIERRVAIVTVVTPFFGAIAAMVWLWNRMIGPVELALFAVMYALTGFGIGVGFHRLLTHQSFQTSRWLRSGLAILGSMAAEGPPLFWVAVHRRHHQFSDREGDPHSPNLHGVGLAAWLTGFWHAHTGWMLRHEITDWARWVPDLLRDKLLRRVNALYLVWVALGLILPAVAGGLIHRTWEGAALGFLWGGLVRMFLVHHSTWCVNSVTHVWGARPLRSRDYSRNNFWIALITFGEGWHNNHHAFPSSADAGFEWWQIDVNKYFIRTLQALRLVWDVKAPGREAIEAVRIGNDREEE